MRSEGLTPRKRKRLERDVQALEAALGPLPAPVPRPGLVVLSGLPGTGKTHLARELARRQPLAVLESDALRKVLVKRPSYSKVENERLFAACHELLNRFLARGVPALLDATNLREVHRRPLYDMAARRGAKLVLVQVTAPQPVVLGRLDARSARRKGPRDRSDAGAEVYEKLRQDMDPITVRHLEVDTSGDIRPALDRIVAELQARQR